MNNETHNPFSLAGKTILVTGASSGIGRATAIECSKMGADVIITARNEGRLSETLALMENNERHRYICADLTTTEGIEKIITEVPNLNGLVQCAGIPSVLPFKFATREKFDNVFNINFFSQVELLRNLYKKKKFERGASVVLVASVAGVSAFSPQNVIYDASKAALHSVMKSCARDLAPKVRINCICPGMIETPLIHNCGITEEQLDSDRKSYPMQRYGKPEEVAYCAVFLLSDASAWITRQDIIIDGGKTI